MEKRRIRSESGEMEHGAAGYIQLVGKREVRPRVRMFWEERGFKGTAGKMGVTWVRETGEGILGDVCLCVDACSRDFSMDLKSH